MCNNLNLDLFEVIGYAKSIKFYQFVQKILCRYKILTITKGHNPVVNLQKWAHNNPNLDLVNINAYEKFGLIPSINSQASERKQNSDKNQVP